MPVLLRLMRPLTPPLTPHSVALPGGLDLLATAPLHRPAKGETRPCIARRAIATTTTRSRSATTAAECPSTSTPRRASPASSSSSPGSTPAGSSRREATGSRADFTGSGCPWNALSRRLEVRVKRDGCEYAMAFEGGEKVEELEVVGSEDR